MWAIWGAQTSILQYAGVVGSGVMAIASVVLFIRVKVGYVLALSGIALTWAYYGPAIWATGSLIFDVLARGQWRLFPVMLLVASSVRVIQKLGHQAEISSTAT